MTNIFLFDIDGTLLNVDPVHLDVYQEVYRDVMGLQTQRDTIQSTFGMSQEVIYDEILARHDQPKATLDQKERLTAGYNNGITKRLEEIDIQPLPGVVNFLDALKSRRDVTGVLTGHKEASGRNILRKLGIESYFSLFGFSDNYPDRNATARGVLHLAAQQGISYNRVVVIGDTESDIEAGRAINAYTVAVATGRVPFEELKQHNPDLALKSLLDYRHILDSV